ncbi:hypothetical protein K1719_018367 [Acacia pycnantha]|nr:hypothetical protein K1719_018367 [Acacia pycnantha]
MSKEISFETTAPRLPSYRTLNVIIGSGKKVEEQGDIIGAEICFLFFHQYQVIGRALPTEADEHPKISRMKLWATNEVRAKSKFWWVAKHQAMSQQAYGTGHIHQP